MTTAPRRPARKDAARNRQRIIEVGRRFVDDELPIQLNDVARSAVVGVATVYRHFPTPEALLETIATPGLEELARHAEQALTVDDAWAALRDFLHAAIAMQLTDAAIQPVMATAQHALPHTTQLSRHLGELFGELLRRAQAAGAVDPSVTPADVAPLLCGVVFAAKVHPGERAATARRYLDVLFDGLRTRRDGPGQVSTATGRCQGR
ncbi:TetR/AcrR family transcriptional regulator [Actinoplanes sp. N902-109]|uniref:TetR/AcrR family transcriptional regulator n=1 Tax=Actinoplanes sp. (strain N902-109) TaxID=649831 RepID=UPI0005A1B9A3|nr:TetR/AcrR family transcriptional regulator [Actinoplanes sp. N902-109]